MGKDRDLPLTEHRRRGRRGEAGVRERGVAWKQAVNLMIIILTLDLDQNLQ